VVIEDLLAYDYEVTGAHRLPSPRPRPEVRLLEIDLGDVGQVPAATSGAHAVIHLGAIPGPNKHADGVVFTNNTRSTFAVLHVPPQGRDVSCGVAVHLRHPPTRGGRVGRPGPTEPGSL